MIYCFNASYPQTRAPTTSTNASEDVFVFTNKMLAFSFLTGFTKDESGCAYKPFQHGSPRIFIGKIARFNAWIFRSGSSTHINFSPEAPEKYASALAHPKMATDALSYFERTRKKKDEKNCRSSKISTNFQFVPLKIDREANMCTNADKV